LQRDVEIRTPYERHSFYTTGLNALKSYLMQIETCTNLSVLRLSCTVNSQHVDMNPAPLTERLTVFCCCSLCYCWI